MLTGQCCLYIESYRHLNSNYSELTTASASLTSNFTKHYMEYKTFNQKALPFTNGRKKPTVHKNASAYLFLSN